MNFEQILNSAKSGDKQSKEELFLKYRPLILKSASIDGIYSEDLYQELSAVFIHCLNSFSMERLV